MLRLLASEEEQLAYERDVPHVDMTDELLCMWFDDLYHGKAPSDDSAFDAAELAAICEFHRSMISGSVCCRRVEGRFGRGSTTLYGGRLWRKPGGRLNESRDSDYKMAGREVRSEE